MKLFAAGSSLACFQSGGVFLLKPTGKVELFTDGADEDDHVPVVVRYSCQLGKLDGSHKILIKTHFYYLLMCQCRLW